MAAPVVTVTPNKAVYTPGELMTITIGYTDADRVVLTFTAVVVDSTGASGTGTATVTIDQGSVTLTSSPSRTITKISDSGTSAVFTAVA